MKTNTVLNTTLNGFYYVDFIRTNFSIQYSLHTFKEKLTLLPKLGVSWSLIANGYKEFHIEGTEKGELNHQDSNHTINRENIQLIVDQKSSFEYTNAFNNELLLGISARYELNTTHSLFFSFDYYHGVFNKYHLNDSFQSYTNTTDILKSRAIGFKLGYLYSLNL